jgi:hypothetical protein
MDTVPRPVDCANGNGNCANGGRRGQQNTGSIRNDKFGKVRNHQTLFGGGLAHHRIVTAQFHRMIWVVTIYSMPIAKKKRACDLIAGEDLKKQQKKKKIQIKTKLKSREIILKKIQSCTQ